MALPPARGARYAAAMLKTPPRHLAALLLLLHCTMAAPAWAQAPAPATVPPVDPALPDQLKELKALVAEPKMIADFQAIGLIQKLTKDLDTRNPKDKERLLKALGDVFRTGKLRPKDKDVLYRETADTMARFGVDAGKELAKVIGDARFKDALELRAHLILALGKTKDPAQVDWLLETTTRAHQDELRAAAAEALGNYTELELKLRREVVKAIIREWGGLHQQATTPDPTDPSQPIPAQPQNARRTLRAVEGKWSATLQKLTGSSQSAFADWQRWLNKNPSWVPPGLKK
jgi:hypothetical protein